MAQPALFVGLVTYEGSRFPLSHGEDGLAHAIARSIPGTVVHVNARNLLDEHTDLDMVDLSRSGVQAWLSAEMQVAHSWGRFLGRRGQVRWWGTKVAGWVRRAWFEINPPSPERLRRLLNIELSHIDLMHRGISSGADWILILEDDAATEDPADLAAGLRVLMAASPPLAFANLSQSFSIHDLGITHLLSDDPDRTWAGTVPRRVLRAQVPVTNTVCAILYSRPFLTLLLAYLDSLPLQPVLPIDWKLNAALMRMAGATDLTAETFLLVDPAPIIQMSMHGTGILPR